METTRGEESLFQSESLWILQNFNPKNKSSSNQLKHHPHLFQHSQTYPSVKTSLKSSCTAWAGNTLPLNSSGKLSAISLSFNHTLPVIFLLCFGASTTFPSPISSYLYYCLNYIHLKYYLIFGHLSSLQLDWKLSEEKDHVSLCLLLLDAQYLLANKRAGRLQRILMTLILCSGHNSHMQEILNIVAIRDWECNSGVESQVNTCDVQWAQSPASPQNTVATSHMGPMSNWVAGTEMCC